MEGIDRGLIQGHRVKHCLTPFQYSLGKPQEGCCALLPKSYHISVFIRRRIWEVRRILVVKGQRKPVFLLSLCRMTAKSCFEDHLARVYLEWSESEHENGLEKCFESSWGRFFLFLFFLLSLGCTLNNVHISMVQIGLWSWDLEELNIEDVWVHVLMQMKLVLSKAAHQLLSKKEW